MDKLSKRKESVLEVLDEQIADLEGKLAKFQPLINELNQLKQTRRVLLSEKSTTGGAGTAGRATLTQEEVIHFLRENGACAPATISEGLGVSGTTVRSHLNRHKNETYSHDPATGLWSLVDGDEDEDDGED